MANSVLDSYKLPEHDTEVYTYESHFKGHEGLYYARTRNDVILTIKDVCVSAKERGGYTGNLNDLTGHVIIFFREAVRLLRDGYGINLGGLVKLILNVGGFFKHPDDPADPQENPVSIRAQLLRGAVTAVKGIHVVNWGRAPAQGHINAITDHRTGTVNNVVTPGGPFELSGVNIRITGTPVLPGGKLGVAFYAPGSPDLTAWVTKTLFVNEQGRIIGTVPDLPPGKAWYVMVRTKYSGGGKQLQDPREIMSGFTVQTA